MRRFSITLAALLFAATAAAQTTTTVTDTVRDITGAIVPRGQVVFQLQPPGPSTISGIGTFSSQTISCTINQAQGGTGTGQISSLVRSSNAVTATFVSSQPFIVGDVLTLASWSDTSFNGTFTVTSVTAGASPTVTWSQTASNSSATGGYISALRSTPGPGSCTVTQNTALTPAGTYYKVTVWPDFAATASFNYYAITASVDLSSVVPTPGQVPAFSFVDLFSNQTISGNKTFTGNVTLTGNLALPANFVLSGTPTFANLITFQSGLTGTGDIGSLDLGTKALSTAHTWSANQIIPNLAGKPAASDAYYYAAQSGSDTTGDGLSKGTAFATVQKCISTVIAKGGGTCDARTLYTYTTSTEIDVGDTTPHCVTLLVPPYGTWTGTMTDGTSYVLKVFGCSAVIGTNSGLGQQFVVEPSASAIVADVCGTPSASPRNYVRMEGFSCIGVSGATINTAVLEVQSLVDDSYISKMVSSNHSANGSGKGLYIHNICCGATVRNVASNSNSVSGGVPCTIGSASDTDVDASIGPINCTSPGTGNPALAIIQDGGSLDRIHDVYTEENGTDTTTPVVQVTCPGGASISPDYLFGFTLGASVGGETRYSVDVASTCAMVLRDIHTGPSGNAINDHNAGRTPVQPGAQAIVAQYDTNNGARTLGSYFSIVNALSSVKLFSSGGGIITHQAPVTASNFTQTATPLSGSNVVNITGSVSIASGFGTSPSIMNQGAGSGPTSIEVNVGTGGTATSGVLTLPAAPVGWGCSTVDMNTNIVTRETAFTTTSVTLTAAGAWTASDKLLLTCWPF